MCESTDGRLVAWDVWDVGAGSLFHAVAFPFHSYVTTFTQFNSATPQLLLVWDASSGPLMCSNEYFLCCEQPHCLVSLPFLVIFCVMS